jgi:hypothetical protein
MKTFDLTKALAGEPVVTRDGEKVTEIYYFQTSNEGRKLVSVIGGKTYSHFEDGTISKFNEVNYDLFMAPKVKTFYVNVYKNEDGEIFMGCVADSLQKTKEIRDINVSFLKTISFEVEE